MLRSVRPEDAEAIAAIYNYYIEHTVITFEEMLVSSAEIEERIRRVTSRFPWLVYEQNGQLKGYAYADVWRTRHAYRFAVESAVYLDPDGFGNGFGTALYRELIGILAESGFCTVIGGIALPNDASIALHEKLGFEKVAHFKKVGYKFNRWVDVGFWELIINESPDAHIPE